jgi:hypothetical protein
MSLESLAEVVRSLGEKNAATSYEMAAFFCDAVRCGKR